MKKKTYIALISALTISGAFLLNGCSFELPGTDATVSAGTELSAEKEILTDGNLQLYSRWYDASGEKLANATVTITDGNETVFEGTTDENGTLEMCTIPGNKELRCVVTNESGDQIAKSDILYKISDSYDSIMIYSTHGESDTQKVEVPTSQQQLSVAIYLTDNKTLSHANITEYTAGTQADTSADGATDASTTEGTTDATPDPGAADTVTPDTAAQTMDPAQTLPADPTTQQPVVIANRRITSHPRSIKGRYKALFRCLPVLDKSVFYAKFYGVIYYLIVLLWCEFSSKFRIPCVYPRHWCVLVHDADIDLIPVGLIEITDHFF